MRLFVKLDGSDRSYVIPCPDTNALVSKLKEDILLRVNGEVLRSDSYRLSLSGNGAVVSDEDVIGDVLKDGDFITICGTENEPEHAGATTDLGELPRYSHSVCHALSEEIKDAPWIELDGNSLTVSDLIKIGEGKYRVKLSEAAVECIKKSRAVVDDFVSNYKVVYGITTGFGKFARVVVPEDQLTELQENLIRSHAAGVGPPLTPDQVRRLLTLRINVLAKGFSGVRLETAQSLVDALNASCLPLVPLKGTVGASGDLAPLSHLALGMMGEGLMWSPASGWSHAADILQAHQLKEVKLAPKEGIALINGTQFITSIGAEAVHRAELVARQSDVIAAFTIDVLQGTPTAFDEDIHNNRPHPGQIKVAAILRALLDSDTHSSEIRENHRDCGRVQDPYSMRCVPQVHGVAHDTIQFVKEVITTEMNSALDNPMVLSDKSRTVSCGNFHGEYPAKMLDYLAIGVHELANISERRLERLMNPAYSDLPAFLVKDGGTNSGFMIAHCTSAALVSENKVLTHPSSVDSISTSAGTEDHVSMGGFSARKALEVVRHVEQVLAIELLAACQALEFHRPLKTTPPLEAIYQLVRKTVKPWNKDRFFAPDIESASKLLLQGEVWQTVEPYIQEYNSQHSPDN